jgi:hypothetical protein
MPSTPPLGTRNPNAISTWDWVCTFVVKMQL